MKTRYSVLLAMAVGFGLGAVAVQGLHAQAKPPVYYIGEIDVTNADAYAKEYQAGAGALIKAAGGRYLAAGKATPIEGAAPKSRVILLAWDSMEALQAWRDSAAFKDGRKIGEKYADFRSFAIAGMPQ
jgi:uncharacterized protein (DUF1330 family)